jgi:type II secretory pathway component PulF
MARYRYSAVTANGDFVKGDAEFLNLGELISSLRSRNLTLYKAVELPLWLQALRFGKLGPALSAEFCYFLSEYMRAGASLRMALQDMAESAPRPRVRSVAYAVLLRVERGDALSVAMQATKVFPAMVINLANVGEETGRLDTALAAVARHYEQVVQLRSTLARSLVYPAIALLLLLSAAVFWVVYVLPKLATLFATLMPQLPSSTRAVLDGSNWLRDNWLWLALPLLMLLVLLPFALRLSSLRGPIDRLKWYLPLFSRIERARVFYLFFANMGLMYGTGMTLSRALEVLLSDPGNKLFGRRLSGLTERIRQGSALNQAMQASKAFETIATSMVRLGESTGSLGTQSERLGEYYQQKLKVQAELMVRLFEPMVLLVIGALLALVVVTIVIPIYELAQQAAGGMRL